MITKSARSLRRSRQIKARAINLPQDRLQPTGTPRIPKRYFQNVKVNNRSRLIAAAFILIPAACRQSDNDSLPAGAEVASVDRGVTSGSSYSRLPAYNAAPREAIANVQPGVVAASVERPNQAALRPAIECTVTRVADGDSMTCGSAGRVRILMVDAPELSQGREGREARDALLRTMPVGTRVRIETDVRESDQYGRILGYVYLPDGRMVNQAMARSGYVTALVYPPNVRHAALIRAAVAEARSAKRGFWASGFFDCSPRDHRARRC